MKVLVASKNPVKISAVKEAFSRYFSDFEVVGIDVDSGVSHQPINDEIYKGAECRARALQNVDAKDCLDAHYFVGIEAGMINENARWFASNQVCIIGPGGKVSYGTSAQYELPEQISKKLLEGIELGTVIDELLKDVNTKQKGGAVELMSRGIVNRQELSAQAVLTALFPHVNPKVYGKTKNQLNLYSHL